MAEDKFFELQNNRRVTVREFRGRTLVDIREFYEQDGKKLPGKKGIALTKPQWETLLENIDGVAAAIEALEGGSKDVKTEDEKPKGDKLKVEEGEESKKTADDKSKKRKASDKEEKKTRKSKRILSEEFIKEEDSEW